MTKYLDEKGLRLLWAKIKAAYAKKTELPSKVSELENDSGFLTLKDIACKSDIGHTHARADITGLDAALDGFDAALSALNDREDDTRSSVTALAEKTARNVSAIAQNRRDLDLLWKLNEGISYDFETDSTEAYAKTVPTGAKVMNVQSIGGKSEVVNGEIISADVNAVEVVGRNLINDAELV